MSIFENREIRNKENLCRPLVSIIIPVYNISRYLPQCLDSVISQTYQNIEIIMINDGSTDDSGSICDQYAQRDGRIHVFHTPNRGPGAARNLGLENARGQFVSFIDSDDWIGPQTIETLLGAAQETEADIVIARYCFEYVGETVHRPTGTEQFNIYRGRDILAAFSEGRFGNVVWDKIFRADCFSDIRFPDGHTYEDVAVTCRIMKKLSENGGSIIALPDELYHFRVRKSSLSHTWTFNNINDCWKSFFAKYKDLPDYQENLLDECFEPIRRMWLSFCGYSKEEKAEAERTIREMQAYSKKNFSKVMKGNYSKLTKVSCMLSQSRSTPAMWIGYCGSKLRQGLEFRKHKMYE